MTHPALCNSTHLNSICWGPGLETTMNKPDEGSQGDASQWVKETLNKPHWEGWLMNY